MTALTLKVISAPEGISSKDQIIKDEKFIIGRDPGCNWCLADTNRVLSKKHCVIERHGEGWCLSDTSTNGTFVNQDTMPLKKKKHDLQDGDIIEFASYKIKAIISGPDNITIKNENYPSLSENTHNNSFTGNEFSSSPVNLTDDFSSFPPNENLLISKDSISINEIPYIDTTPSERENSPIHEAYKPPNVVNEIISDNWDEDPVDDKVISKTDDFSDSDVIKNHLSDEHDLTPSEAEQTSISDQDVFYYPDTQTSDSASSVTEYGQAPAYEDIQAEYRASSVSDTFIHEEVSPHAEENIQADIFADSATPDSEQCDDRISDYNASSLKAFLQGAGMEKIIDLSDLTPEIMNELGKSFRAMIHGLRQIMIARATIKGEFRIEQTMIQAAGNNPLKFSSDDDDALMAMIGIGRRSGMPPSQAITESLNDMSLHEFAVINAMQSAVLHMLTRMEPARFTEDAGDRFFDFLPVNKAGRAFAFYADTHKNLTSALKDDFDSSFGKDFARSYEKALTSAEKSLKNTTHKAEKNIPSADGDAQ